MNRNIRITIRLIYVLLLLTAIGVGTSLAAVYDLQTGVIVKTMPDGTEVTMWGFGIAGGPIQVPGPVLEVPAGDTELTINLTNNLTVPVSIIIGGQKSGTAMTPVWIDPVTGTITATGSRAAGDVTSRVRSLTHEIGPGLTGIYTWTNLQPGTYLYKSGTHMQVQVPMGLYGAMKMNVVDPVPGAPGTPGEAYTGKTFDVDQVLLYSEIDPAIVNQVAGGFYGTGTLTSTVNYKPRYFLINGEPFTYGRSPIPIGLVGQTTLLRFLNAGNEEYVPILQSLNMSVIAEDGKPYLYPKNQYSLLLAGGKSIDALITPTVAGYLPLYDRRLRLTNAASSPGGLRVYLNVPSATEHVLTVVVTGSGKVQATGLPGGIDCGLGAVVCQATYNLNTPVTLTATAHITSAFTGWSGDLTGTTNPAAVTMDADKTVNAAFAIAVPLTLTYPNGGESLRRGTSYTITWNYQGNPGPNVRLELWRTNSGGTMTQLQTVIKASTPIGSNGTGSFAWKVQPRIPATTFKVKIISTTNGTAWDASDGNFTIR
jgi:FtsP/CotA-like multicopper oxidase with cupredoxin domain